MSTIDIETADLFLPGRYRVEVLRVFLGKDAAKKPLFVVETLVLKSDNQRIPIYDEREWICPVEPGLPLNRIKAFVGACHGYNPKTNPGAIKNNISMQIIDQAVCWINPLQNARLDLYCYESKQGRTGEKILSHAWSPLKTAKAGQLPRRKKDTLLSKSLRYDSEPNPPPGYYYDPVLDIDMPVGEPCYKLGF